MTESKSCALKKVQGGGFIGTGISIFFLINRLKEQENITEELKATNQIKWVGKMNNIKN